MPVVANYPPHAITERFNFLTAFPLARSVTPVMGGVNGHTAQTFSRPARKSWAEPTDQSRHVDDRRGGARRGEGRQDGAGCRSAPWCRPRRSTPTRPSRPPTRASKPETRVAVIRRFGLRRQRRPGHSGQSRPVPEHHRVAVAAGESDRHPGQGARRSTDHADGDAAEQHPVDVAADRSRLHLRVRRLHLVAETVNERIAIHHRAGCRARRPGGLHLLRHLEDARPNRPRSSRRSFPACNPTRSKS